jgi:chaperone required for assembly of F1-ATPase
MKRFYEDVAVTTVDGGWQVTLDGRAIKTVKGAAQLAPSEALAQAMAEEWAGQGDKIDPTSLVMRDMADFAIDLVANDIPTTIATLVEYGETDTLCYRADPEDALYKRQQEEWEPFLQSIEERHRLRFHRISGVIHKHQPTETMASLRNLIGEFDHFTLAGLQNTASLSASLCIALETVDPECDPDALWQLASLEEEWQAELWGREELAEERRAQRGKAFAKACEFIRLARS